MVLRPVAVAYRDVVPQPLRTGIRNVLGNLRTPVILANDMLQGEPRRAGDTLGRFLINPTLGLGGIFDVAGNKPASKGIPRIMVRPWRSGASVRVPTCSSRLSARPTRAT